MTSKSDKISAKNKGCGSRRMVHGLETSAEPKNPDILQACSFMIFTPFLGNSMSVGIKVLK